MRKYAYLLAASALYSALLALSYNPLWIVVIVSSAIIYGVLGNLVAMRKMYFLASASPHVALLAVILSIPTSYYLSGPQILYSVFYGLLLIYAVGYMVHRGVDSSVATSIVVGLATSLSVLAMYYVLTYYSIEYSLYALMLGDPLLVSLDEVLVVVLLAIGFLAASALTYSEQLSIAVDLESTRLSGVRVWAFDFLAYTLLGVGVIGLLRVVGYILEHVLLLIPPSIAVISGRSARETYLLTLTLAINTSLLGLHLAILLDQPPSGLIGVVLLIVYLAALVSRRLSK